MRRERNRPTHSLGEAKRLAREGRINVNRRTRHFIQNRCERNDIQKVVAELFEAVTEKDFYKSEALDVVPGEWGDVYRHVVYDDEEWYVKFFIRKDGTAVLSVMSANWEDYMH